MTRSLRSGKALRTYIQHELIQTLFERMDKNSFFVHRAGSRFADAA